MNSLEHSQAKAPNTKGNASALKPPSRRTLVFVTLFWCGLTGMFDAHIFSVLFGQLQSYWFRETPARILESQVIRDDDSEGVAYGVKFVYAYAVDGKEYTSDRFTFDTTKSSDGGWARRAVQEYPGGSERICYYAPWNPARAILSRGLHGSDLMMLIFMMPFNVGGGFLIWAIIFCNDLETATFTPRAMDTFQNREAWSMAQYTPLACFLGMLMIGTFLGMFVCAIPSGFHPSLAKASTVWGIVLALSVGAALVSRGAASRGEI